MFMNCVRIFLYFFLFCTISTFYASYSNFQASMAILAEDKKLIEKFCPIQLSRAGIVEKNRYGQSYTAMGFAAKEKKSNLSGFYIH